MKLISPKLHGIIDYLFVIFLWASPTLFNMDGLLATFTYILGAVHLLITVFTNFEPGLIKVIPFNIHGLIELIVGPALIVIAYTLFVNNETGKVFYTAIGAIVLVVWLLTDFNKRVVVR